jgi:REP element-mobilizing transposase RayT
MRNVTSRCTRPDRGSPERHLLARAQSLPPAPRRAASLGVGLVYARLARERVNVKGRGRSALRTLFAIIGVMSGHTPALRGRGRSELVGAVEHPAHVGVLATPTVRREASRPKIESRLPVRNRRNDIAPMAIDAYAPRTMQVSLFDRPKQIELARTQHGGEVRRGQRKLERPVSTRRPMQVVLTSRRAKGPLSLRKHDRAVREVLRRMARRFEVRIYDFANVGSHLHLVLRARRREGFQGFLRSFAGIVARRVMGAERARPSGPFFDGLAWSRVVSGGRDYWGLRHYVFRNQIEGDQGSGIRKAFERGPSATPRSPPPT